MYIDTYCFQAATAAAATLVRPTPWRRGLERMVSSTLWSTCAGFRSSLPLCSGRRPDRSTTFRCVDKKRKKIESSSESSDSDEEETFTPKKAKIDLSVTECYKCHKTGHMSRKFDTYSFFVCLFLN